MTNVLFEVPEQENELSSEQNSPEPEQIKHEPEPAATETQKQPEPSIFESWTDETENPSELLDKPQPKHEEEEEEDEEHEEESEEQEEEAAELGLDAESLDIISEAIIQSNDEGAKFLINWLNGPDAEPFLGAPKNKLETLQKAWRGILLRIKYKPSGWDALFAAEWNAYGWHLAAAMFSFIARWFKGLVRWPWQAAKAAARAVSPEPEPEPTTVESAGVVLDGADFTGKSSKTQPPEPETKSSEPYKVCLETNQAFRGDGSPKTSVHKELIGKFKDIGAYRAYCNRHGLSGPKSKKSNSKT